MTRKRLLAGIAMPAFAFALVVPAMAQSTGSEYEETVTVTATRAKSKGGLIANEKITKTRSSVTEDFIETQQTGQSINQMINLLPGVNFTNNDPYGSSGGNIRLRGFDGPRISQTLDGMPLNDTGNYALYTNQQVDGEIIDRATVNLGTTDVDSPTASATGGTINILTRRPDEDPTARINVSVGSNEYRRIFASVDTGAIEDWGTSAWFSGSYQVYDKFKGRGELEKKQINGKIYQDLGGDDFIALSFHWNENRNNSYRNASKADLEKNGYDYDFLDDCIRPTPEFNTRQNEGAAPYSDCSNYYGVRINPSDTGNIRVQSSFELTDSIRLTVDPSFQWVTANGGSGNAVYNEYDGRLIGNTTASGVDLNGDGDTLDSIRMHSTSNTRTRRYGLTASLIWELDDNNTIRAAYTVDYGRHAQTGAVSYLDQDGKPVNVFAGLEGPKVYSADGYYLRSRDRFSIAKLNQFALSYTGMFLDDALRVNIGVRAPYFDRELNQYCYSRENSSTVYCTPQTVAALPNGNVTIPGQSGEWVAPYDGLERSYDEILPNVGVSYEFAEGHTVYASYAKGLSAPRTDNLYTPRLVDGTVSVANSEPETTDSFDLGYRFAGDEVSLTAALWHTDYENRIVNAYDEELGVSVFRNLGSVELQGFDFEVGYEPEAVEGLLLYASASYLDSEVKDDIFLGNRTIDGVTVPTYLPTGGKELVESPEWTVGGRIQYAVANFTFGIQGKYVGDRFSSDVNDEIAEAYTVFDADIRFDFADLGYEGTYIQLNATNLFDEDYLGSISSSEQGQTVVIGTNPSTGADITRAATTLPFYNVGSPQTFQVTFGVQF